MMMIICMWLKSHFPDIRDYKEIYLLHMAPSSPSEFFEYKKLKGNVWCTFTSTEMVCPGFFIEKSVNISVYLTMIENYNFLHLERCTDIIFHQAVPFMYSEIVYAFPVSLMSAISSTISSSLPWPP
jgi:hypothetical protein